MSAQVGTQDRESGMQPLGHTVPTCKIGAHPVNEGNGWSAALATCDKFGAVRSGYPDVPQFRAFHTSRKRGISSPIHTWFITLVRIAAYSAEKKSDT